MNPWYGYAFVLLGIIVTLIIRAPHGERSRAIPVVDNRKSKLDMTLIVVVSIAMIILPIITMATNLLSFADHTLYPLSFFAGAVLMVISWWLFYRSHADLGTNWSPSLELREKHQLITTGIYTYIRHPMYTSLFLYAIAQALLLPNWFSGPSFLIGFVLLYVLRIEQEEKMMVDKFGDQYLVYCRRTKRLLPWVY